MFLIEMLNYVMLQSVRNEFYKCVCIYKFRWVVHDDMVNQDNNPSSQIIVIERDQTGKKREIE